MLPNETCHTHCINEAQFCSLHTSLAEQSPGTTHCWPLTGFFRTLEIKTRRNVHRLSPLRLIPLNFNQLAPPSLFYLSIVLSGVSLSFYYTLSFSVSLPLFLSLSLTLFPVLAAGYFSHLFASRALAHIGRVFRESWDSSCSRTCSPH